MYFYYNSLSGWIYPSETITYNDASYIPYTYNGTTYDADNGMSSTRKVATHAEYNNIRITFPATQLLWDRTNAFNNGSRYGYPALLTSKTSISGLTALETTTICGKYRVPSALPNEYTNGFSTVKVSCAFDGNNYDYLAFTTGKSFTVSGYESENLGSNYLALGFIKKENANELALHITSWYPYKDKIIDFGRTPQTVPKFFADFFNNNFEYIYPYSFTVKSQDGTEVYTSINEVPSMVKSYITEVGTLKTLILTGSNGVEYTLTWDSITPEGKQFTGISFYPNSKIANIPIGVETYFNLEGDVSLYESYGIYRPQVTTFNVNLYQNTAEANRVDKTRFISSVGTLSGVLRDESSITDVTITFESESIPTFNYVYIPVFNRYYFVNDITSLKYKLWQMSLSVDPLMTYKDAILSCNGFIDRNENEYNTNIIDKKRVVAQGHTVQVDSVTNELFTDASGTYVLNGLLVSIYTE